jgi:hypothetical protein
VFAGEMPGLRLDVLAEASIELCEVAEVGDLFFTQRVEAPPGHGRERHREGGRRGIRARPRGSLRATLIPMPAANDSEILRARAAEKQASRQRDEQALARGEKSADDLRRENGLLGLDRRGVLLRLKGSTTPR